VAAGETRRNDRVVKRRSSPQPRAQTAETPKSLLTFRRKTGMQGGLRTSPAVQCSQRAGVWHPPAVVVWLEAWGLHLFVRGG